MARKAGSSRLWGRVPSIRSGSSVDTTGPDSTTGPARQTEAPTAAAPGASCQAHTIWMRDHHSPTTHSPTSPVSTTSTSTPTDTTALAHAASAPDGALEDVAPTRPSALRRFFAWLLGTNPVSTGRTSPVHPAQSWLVGAAGERQVAEVLLSLTRSDPLWQSIHSVPVGTRGSDIDHVVLGPGGIFTINTKHHPRGKVWVGGDVTPVNGVARPYVRSSRHEAARASRLLSTAAASPSRSAGWW